MNQIITIQIHSVIDTITNSSTELFVSNTHLSEDTIRDLIDTVASAMQVYCDVGRIERVTEENIEYWVDRLAGYDLPYNVRNKLTDTIEDRPKMDYRSNLTIQERIAKYDADVEAWREKNMPILRDALMGFIMIQSADDNSIAYEMFDWIESKFDASRIHLG